MKPIRIWTSRNRPYICPYCNIHIYPEEKHLIFPHRTQQCNKKRQYTQQIQQALRIPISNDTNYHTHISEMILGTYNPIKKKYTYETNSTRLLIIDYLLWDIYEQTSKTTDFQQIKPLIISRYHKILRLNKKMPKLLAYE